MRWDGYRKMTPNERVRVLQIQVRYSTNASNLAEQITVGLPTDRYEVTTLFLRGRPDINEPVSTAEHSVYFDFSPAELKGFRRWLAVRRLYQFCRQQGFDVVIAHRFKPISMMMWVSCLLKDTVFVGIQHSIGDYDRLMRRLEARILIHPRWRIVGVSRAVLSYLTDTVGAFNPNNTLAINNAIDIDRARSQMLESAAARAHLGLPVDKQIVGCIGRLARVKGHALLIQAFAQIAGRYPDTLLVIIGEGRLRAELEALTAQYGLQQQVLLLGAQEAALKYVRAFDIFVMPSFSEGLPLALLEALAGERPVIGSNISSMSSILQDCGGGIFRSGDAADLAVQLSCFLDMEPEQRHAKGRLGLDYLYGNHTIEDFRRNYRELLDTMLTIRKSS